MSDKKTIEQLQVEKDLRWRLEETMTGRGYWFKKCLSLKTELMQASEDLVRMHQVTGKAQIELTDACAARDALSADRQALAAELADARCVALSYLRMATERKKELAQARTWLSVAKKRTRKLYDMVTDRNRKLTDASAARDALARECNQLEAEREYNASLVVKKDRKLAQSYKELKGLRSANKSLGQHVTDIKKNRDYWYDKAVDAEAERDKARQEAQAQSDLSGAEMGEALRTEVRKRCEAEEYVNDCRLVLTRVREALDKHQVEGKYDASITMRIEWLAERAAAPQAAIVEAAGALATRLQRRLQYKAELNALEETLVHKSKAAAKLLERLTEAENLAQKAQGPSNKVQELLKRQLAIAREDRNYWRIEWRQDHERLAVLDAAEAALADCGIGDIYDEFTGLTDAIEQMAQYIDELTREDRQCTGQAEALQAATRGRRAAEADAHTLSKALDECTQTVHTERALKQEAERCYAKLRKECQCAEALVAQLVNEETAGLLGRLASHAHSHFHDNDAGAARALAARIREALALEANDAKAT